MVRAYKYILKVIPLLAFIWGCAPEAAPEGSDTNAESSQQNNGGATCDAVDLPDAPPAGGQLVFTVDDSVDPCEVSGYVVGYQEDLKVELANDGNLFINNIPPGEFDVVVGTLAVPALHLNTAKKKALRLGKSEFLAGVRKNKNKIDLPIAGGISGKVTLSGQTDHAGIKVYIPGTSFDATTDSNGNYTISPFVPVGINNLYFEKDGYHRGQIENIDVQADKVTTVNDISLVLSTGAEGFISLEAGAEISNSRTVKVLIGATPDAVLMKISESDTFNNVAWQPINTTSVYEFDSEGSKTLYVKFSDANGLESSPFEDSISVDIFENTNEKIVLTKKKMDLFTADINLPDNATYMKLYLDQNLLDTVEWQPIASPIDFYVRDLKGDCGENTLFIQFKDADEFQSQVFEKQFDVKCWETFGESENIAGRVGSGAVWTGADLIIWSGSYGAGALNTGISYNLGNNDWREISTLNAPNGRELFSTVWTGTEMIVWGGYSFIGSTQTVHNDGGAYNPTTDIWTSLSTVNAPNARHSHAACWTGSKMIVWGGRYNSSYLTTGGIYDPRTNMWEGMSTVNAPEGRTGVSSEYAACAGSKMFIWGGQGQGGNLNTGGIYDADSDSWSDISTVNAPDGRNNHSVEWVGGKLVVFGGATTEGWVNTGGVYDIETQTWSEIDLQNSPEVLHFNLSVTISEEEMFVWGASNSNDGGIYNVRSNTWLRFPEIGKPVYGEHYPGGESIQHAFFTGNSVIGFGINSFGYTPDFGFIFRPWSKN